MRRILAVLGLLAVIVILVLVGSHFTRHVVSLPAPHITPIPTTTSPPTATTAVPPTIAIPTTTIPTATVPNAASVGESTGSSVLAGEAITRAGFTYSVVPTNSGACYFTSPLTGQQAWNSGEVIGQNPDPGTVAPVGSMVNLRVCSGTASINP